MMMSIVRRLRPGMPPQEVRAAREANAWSLQEFSEALWVSPLEAEAWEAGSVAPSRGQEEWIRWHGEMGVRDRAFAEAGLSPCAWARDRAAQYPPERRGSHPSDFSRPEIALHVRQCRACLPSPLPELLQSPAPEPPLAENIGRVDWFVGGWRRAEHLPLAERVVWRVLAPTGLLAGGLLFMETAFGKDDGFDLPLKPFLIFLAGYLVFLLTSRPMRSFGDDHPWIAWQVRTAAVLGSMLLVWAGLVEGVELTNSGALIFAAVISALIGGAAGAIAVDSRAPDEYLGKTVALTLPACDPASAPSES
ncbi:MAG: hypothetical protein KY467_01010 [Gemmatimonadetes bacterium]|nr:hypothetical protein [Gemmatimonadota bacterium]